MNFPYIYSHALSSSFFEDEKEKREIVVGYFYRVGFGMSCKDQYCSNKIYGSFISKKKNIYGDKFRFWSRCIHELMQEDRST